VIAAFALIPPIPMPGGVPMTLQTFAVPLAGVVLGAKKGTLSVLIYIMLGAFGAPVFQGMNGGFGVIFGPTGGFILAFPLMALMAGIGASSVEFNVRSTVKQVLWLVMGAVALYTIGMFWFVFIMSADIRTAFTACVLPFVPTEIIKIIMAAVIGRAVKLALTKTYNKTTKH